MRVTLSTALFCLCLAAPAQAATFNCDKASTFAEKAICSDSRLTVMDDELGRLYKDALAASPDSAALKAEQKAWLASRDRCKDLNCITQAYEDRIAALKSASAPAKAGGVTGTYKAANGDVLVLDTGDGKIKFAVSAVHQTNTGEVSGQAPLNGSTAHYVDKDNDCIMWFMFGQDKLKVDQDGICGMGLNVTASGSYKRTSSAPPKFDE